MHIDMHPYVRVYMQQIEISIYLSATLVICVKCDLFLIDDYVSHLVKLSPGTVAGMCVTKCAHSGSGMN